jgi:hypothetical protein
MKRLWTLALGLVALASVSPPAHAEWGWPPPGYSATGIRACDGSQYRGLCAVIRDRRHGHGPVCVPDSPGSCDADGPAAPATTRPAPQLPPPGAGAHR